MWKVSKNVTIRNVFRSRIHQKFHFERSLEFSIFVATATSSLVCLDDSITIATGTSTSHTLRWPHTHPEPMAIRPAEVAYLHIFI